MTTPPCSPGCTGFSGQYGNWKFWPRREDEIALTRELRGRHPDVLVIDYDPSRGDALSLCRRIKSRPATSSVLIYTAYSSPALTVAARAAQADGLLDKSEPASALLEAIHRIANGETKQCAIGGVAAAYLVQFVLTSGVGLIDAAGNLVNTARGYWPVPALNFADRDYFAYFRERDDPGAYVSVPCAQPPRQRLVILSDAAHQRSRTASFWASCSGPSTSSTSRDFSSRSSCSRAAR